MSAWRVGTGRGSQAGLAADGQSPTKEFIDKLTVWIPGDVIALFVVGVTALLNGGKSGPNVLWLVIMAIATPLIVWLGAWASHKSDSKTGVRALLALIAFLIWSMTVPDSGWQKISWVAKNSVWVALIAGLIGIFFGIIAERITPTT
jgi:hypothetical protein